MKRLREEIERLDALDPEAARGQALTIPRQRRWITLNAHHLP